MLVSIIIRNYNYQEYVSDAVDSALAQTYPDIEVIVVDDGSTDDSRRILRSYGDRIHLITQENGGEGAAANSGFARARGEMVIFLDSDDVLMPECVARAVAEMERPGMTRVHWWMYLIDGQGRLTGHIQPPGPVPRLSFEESMRTFGCVSDVGQSFNAYRRSALEAAFPLDVQGWMRGPDVFLSAVAVAAGETAFIDEPLGGYRVHERNLSLLNSLNVVNEQYSLRIMPQLHADLIALLGPKRRAEIGATFPLVHWRNRLASLRLSPKTHPYPEDRRGELVARSIEHIRKRNWTSTSRKGLLVLGTLALGYLPRTILRPLYPTLARIARRVSLFRGGRRPFREHAPKDMRPGMNWRKAFKLPPADEHRAKLARRSSAVRHGGARRIKPRVVA